MTRRNRGVRVDLIEPEMTEPSHAISGAAEPSRQNGMFPFPYEGVVPHYHPNVQHSIEPSRTDDSISPDGHSDTRTIGHYSAPTPSLRKPMDQLDEDLARLQGVADENPSISQLDADVRSTSRSRVDSLLTSPGEMFSGLGEGQGQVHHPYIHKTYRKRAASITTFTQSSNSGSISSHRARRKSDVENVSKGKYFHLPPSAQYLENIARYPGNVDPERPWDIRRDARAS